MAQKGTSEYQGTRIAGEEWIAIFGHRDPFPTGEVDGKVGAPSIHRIPRAQSKSPVMRERERLTLKLK